MFGFLFGWGVFWLLIWLVALFLAALAHSKTKSDGSLGLGTISLIGVGVSFIWLFAVLAGRLVS